ncbi:MAG: hypothetical protein GWN13_10360, partial [Phycisphaerae bacterium]|nr:hypothetical protein [Phycisphaerae bacterium]NIW98626.1 hypothetical protein [Phycisphaerae bacterium]
MKRKMQLPREIKILAGLYSFTGFYCLPIATLLLYAIMAGRWWLYAELFMILVAVVFAFFLVAYGLLRRERWARTLGFVLSGLATGTMLLTLMPI